MAWVGTAGATNRCNQGAAAEADAIGEQLERAQSGSSWSGRNGTEVDASGEQQLKRTQSGSSSSAQRAVRHQITHVGE